MLPYRRIIVIVFAIVLFSSVCLLAIYFWQSRGCVTKIESPSKNIKVSLNDRNKWQNFINTIGNCQNGRFTVYIVSGDNRSNPARVIKYSFSDESQEIKSSNSDKEILYTHSYSYDAKKQLANVVLNFPDTAKIDENLIGGVVVLTSYSLFKGKPMVETDENLKQFFNNLAGLGLKYENR